MNPLVQAFFAEFAFELPDSQQLARVSVRLTLAAVLAAVIGWERERGHKTAGLRTHMLVAMGSALLVVTCDAAGISAGETTRVVQGIAAGIGFIGGGAILKVEEQNRIRGLTTAGSIWMAASLGVAAGFGRLGAAVVGLAFAWVILVVLEGLKHKLEHEPAKSPDSQFQNQGADATQSRDDG